MDVGTAGAEDESPYYNAGGMLEAASLGALLAARHRVRADERLLRRPARRSAKMTPCPCAVSWHTALYKLPGRSQARAQHGGIHHEGVLRFTLAEGAMMDGALRFTLARP
jgi:hypothetical protein